MTPITRSQLVRSLPREVRRRLSTDGLASTAGWIRHQCSSRYREWKLGINTRHLIESGSFDDDPACLAYAPTDYRCLDIVLSHLAIRQGVDAFIDYGCGEGRVVVQAAMRPFRKVVGVERSPEKCVIAADNVRRARRRLSCPDIDIVHADAARYPLPTDITTVFLYNPFIGHVLEAVLERIRESLAAAPRDLSLVYVLPVGAEDRIARCDWLERERRLSTGFWDQVTCHVYRSSARSPHALASSAHESTAP